MVSVDAPEAMAEEATLVRDGLLKLKSGQNRLDLPRRRRA
jgi:hypothetical protein